MKSNILFSFFIIVSLLAVSCRKDDENNAGLKINTFSPEDAAPGSIMRIVGTGFSATASENTVLFGSEEATAVQGIVLEATTTKLSVRIPENIPYTSNTVFVRVKGITAKAVIFYTPAPLKIEGEIVKDCTLKGNRTYLIRGNLRVKAPAILTIEPNTIIKGEKSTLGTLIIEQGAKLVADGKTPETSIVFTSDQPKGFSGRDFRDWGGIIMLGKAPGLSSSAGSLSVEGIKETLPYGGAEPSDDSGILKYVRIEFAGARRNLAGLTLAGIGSKTLLEYIQVSYAEYDGFGFIGGQPNAKHLIAFSCKEDDFDFSEGFNGKIQYALANKDPYISATNEYSDGIEVRKSGGVVANFTYMGGMALLRQVEGINGEPAVSPINGGNRVVTSRHGMGVYITGNSSLKLFNSAILGGSLAGVGLDEAAANNYPSSAEEMASFMAGNALLGTREGTLPSNPLLAGEFGVVQSVTPTGDINFFNHFENGVEPNPTNELAKNLRLAFRSNNIPDNSGKSVSVVSDGSNTDPHDLQLKNKVYDPWGVRSMLNWKTLNGPNLLPEGSNTAAGGLRLGEANVEDLPEGIKNESFKGAFGTLDWSKGWTNFNPRQAEY